MANKFILKRSTVAGKVPLPADLQVGELAVNLADKLLYTKDANNAVQLLNAGAGVASFNTRTGAVSLTSADVTGALGYTPISDAGGTMSAAGSVSLRLNSTTRGNAAIQFGSTNGYALFWERATNICRLNYDAPIGVGSANIMNANSAGRVGFGVDPATNYRVNIQSDVSYALRVRGTTPGAFGAASTVLISAPNDASIEFYNDENNIHRRIVHDASGNLSIGTSQNSSNFTHTFYNNGQAGKLDGAGSWVGMSDERLKTNFQPIEPAAAWRRIDALLPTNYEWRHPEAHGDQTGTRSGFLAQNWKTAYPSATYEMLPAADEKHLIPEGEKALGIGFNADFYADLVAVVKDLKAQLNEAKARISALEAAAL